MREYLNEQMSFFKVYLLYSENYYEKKRKIKKIFLMVSFNLEEKKPLKINNLKILSFFCLSFLLFLDDIDFNKNYFFLKKSDFLRLYLVYSVFFFIVCPLHCIVVVDVVVNIHEIIATQTHTQKKMIDRKLCAFFENFYFSFRVMTDI